MASCRIDGKKIYPCSALYETAEPMSKRGKGIQHLIYTNIETHSFSREFYIAKSGEHKSSGVILNFCPFCGVKLHAENDTTPNKGE